MLKTTIQISNKLKNVLKSMKNTGDTYNDVIKRLIEYGK